MSLINYSNYTDFTFFPDFLQLSRITACGVLRFRGIYEANNSVDICYMTLGTGDWTISKGQQRIQNVTVHPFAERDSNIQ